MEKETLYEFCLKSIMADDNLTEVKQLIEASEDGSIKKNDLIYALFLQLSVLQKSVEFMHQMQGAKYKAIIEGINEALKKNRNEIKKEKKCDQATQTIMIRRIAATFNERKIIKTIILIIIACFFFFAGVGVSSIYFFNSQKANSKKETRHSLNDFLKLHKDISNEK